MHPSVVYLEFFLIFLGSTFLVFSLFPIRELIVELNDGPLKSRWKFLSILIIGFVLGYLAFGYGLWTVRNELHLLSLIAVSMLFGGGIFVFFVGRLALNTMSDVKKIALLQHESITDGLTGVKNRRYFDQRLSEEIFHSKRYKLSLSLLLLDVDHFKKINDTYGHKIGDEVLKNLSLLVMATVRDSDIVARYGGEEVAIIAPSTSREEAELLAERLRNVIEKTTMATIDATQEVVQATVSIGVCSLGLIVQDKDALIEEADRALYMAKSQGRNKVVLSRWV